jgi:tRNA-specific 2-thiouridylase
MSLTSDCVLRGVACGQTLVFYRPDPGGGDEVLGSANIVGTRG